MALAHSNSNRLALHRKINLRNSALMKFLEEHPSTHRKPWTDAEAKKHQQLLMHWYNAVTELYEFEHPFLPTRA